MMEGPALGLLELCSIARGIRTCDAMIKRAPVRVIRAATTHPGKYVILLRGGVDEIAEALGAGREVADDNLIDEVFLPNPHDDLLAVLEAESAHPLESLAIVETFSVASTIRAADAALKAADVRAIRIGLARDLGGKGYFVMTGKLHDVEAAVAAGVDAIGGGLVAGAEIIANPHADLVDALR